MENATSWPPEFLLNGASHSSSGRHMEGVSPGLLLDIGMGIYDSENTSQGDSVHIITPKQLKDSQMFEHKVARFLLTYILPVIIFGGTIGNVLSFAVLVRKRMRSTPVYLYLAVLACMDTAVLYLSAFKTWIRLFTGIEALHTSPASCKLLMFFILFALHMAAWLVVLITLERFTVVWFPFKAPSMCSLRKAAILLTSLAAIMVVYNLHVLWTMHLQIKTDNDSSVTFCDASPNDYFMNNIFEYMKFVSYSILPFVIVFSLNMCIISKVYQQTKTPRCASLSEKMDLDRALAQKRTTYMLLTVTFVWLVLTAPFTMWSLISDGATSTAHRAARAFLSKIICFLLMYLNHSINFFLYCLAGKRFRRELRELFCVSLSHGLRMRRRSTRTYRTPILNSREREANAANANSDKKDSRDQGQQGQDQIFPLLHVGRAV